jgi:hypothetical protein
MSYLSEAEEAARDCVRYYAGEIIEQLQKKGTVSDDLFNDYAGGDAYHHENHVDKWYNLVESAQLLSELRDHEETDSGLWDSQDPEDAVRSKAAYTYGNAVYAAWRTLIEQINDDAQDILDEYNDLADDAEIEIESLGDGEEYEGDTPEEIDIQCKTALAAMVDLI